MIPNVWLLRRVGEAAPVRLDDPHRVLEGLREGEWEPEDEVRGPGDTLWRPIEDHPAFADAVAEMGPPPVEPPDETKLDMNPLIDVALVLLIFFILTATYTSLRRVIDIPPPESEGPSKTPMVEKKDIVDRVFRVYVVAETDAAGNDSAKVTIKDRGEVPIADLEKVIAEIIHDTGRKEMYLEVADDVKWGVEAKVFDAAKGAGVVQIYTPGKK